MGISKTRASSMALLVAASLVLARAQEAKPQTNTNKLTLLARSRQQMPSGEFRVLSDKLNWAPSQTAIIICDVWDQHWCKGANRRGAELAP
ncbi:MAG: hypothetical protein ACYTDV_16135, partial [Planctomycetota bacterium]